MADAKLFPIISKPGIQRDGTLLAGDAHVDGQWVRWQRGFPRKIGGYRSITNNFAGPARALHVQPRSGQIHTHLGSAGKFEKVVLSPSGYGDGIADRTPAGLVSDAARSWDLGVMWDPTGMGTSRILAHSAMNIGAIDSDISGPVYIGGVYDGDLLIEADTIPPVSGGLAVVHPFLFVFGSDGYVAWSDAGLPLDFTGGVSSGPVGARIGSTKIVAGKPIRSGASGPAALFWSLDSVIRATFVGGDAVFDFDTMSAESSILSSRGVVEFDGVFYWPGTDRFLMYNGVVRELPNTFNRDWFFDGLNYAQRQKVWGMKVPRFGEIWWFYPRGSATECTHATIFNVRENCWYDVELGRSAGYYSQVFPYPLMADTGVDDTCPLWQHEFQFDRIVGGTPLAIRSFYETGDVSLTTTGPLQGAWTGIDNRMNAGRIEPDFVQSGDMTVTVVRRPYARGEDEESSFAFSPGTQKIDMKVAGRQVRFRVESNTLGGYYEGGMSLAHLDMGDGRP